MCPLLIAVVCFFFHVQWQEESAAKWSDTWCLVISVNAFYVIMLLGSTYFLLQFVLGSRSIILWFLINNYLEQF